MLSSSLVSTNLRKNTKRVIIHWFRNGDLRVHDNQALTRSSEMSKSDDPLSAEVYPVIPIYCFDEKIFGDHNKTPAGSLKCGPRRAQFIIESVIDLRQQLRDQVGTHLLVAHGEPCDIVDNLLTQLKKFYNKYEIAYGNSKVDLDVEIVCQSEYATEEREGMIDMTHLLRKRTKDKTRMVTEVWGSTLYSHKKSPFDWMCRTMPNDFRDFSVRMIKRHKVEPLLPVPEHLPFPDKFKIDMLTNMPTLRDLGYTDEQISEAERIDPHCDVAFRGGETVAFARVHEYVWEKNLLVEYKHRRRAPILEQQTSKLSPWLAHGCLSPRFLAAEATRACVNKAEKHKYNAMIEWELIQRDYCKYYTVKHGKYIFLREGPMRPKRGDIRHLPNRRIASDFEAWTEGRTGFPLIDASMRELKATGWMSNRSRMNAASFLFADLDHDWTRGADWFESQLIDYNVYGNWVNWCISNGLNVGKQYARLVPQIEGRKYDPDGDYVKRWVPELKDVNREYVHRPWKMDDELQEKYNVRLGVDYPHPIRDPSIGDIRRKRRYMKRLGKEWPLEEEKTDIKNIASNRQDEDWYGENEHEERKSGTKWSVSLDEADDEEFTSRQ